MMRYDEVKKDEMRCDDELLILPDEKGISGATISRRRALLKTRGVKPGSAEASRLLRQDAERNMSPETRKNALLKQVAQKRKK